MSPVRDARTPPEVLYRIARLPDPLAWPPAELVGAGRFDDPRHAFRVLYAAAQRRAAFVETVARFRPSLETLAGLRKIEGDLEPSLTRVPPDWYQKRAVVRLRLRPRQRWLDLRAPETWEVLRRALAATLIELNLGDLDLAAVVGPIRPLTQAVARWAHEHGYAGLVYTSRFDARLTCWAVFEGAGFDPVGTPEPIAPDDPDLVSTARLFGLVV